MPVSDAYRREFFAAESQDPLLWLCELYHPDLMSPELPDGVVRLVRDHQPLTHQGHVYQPAGFTIELPEQGEGVTAQARLAVENVSRGLVGAIRAAREPAQVWLKGVLASQPDVIEEEWPEFDLVAVTGDVATLTGDLAYPALEVVRFGPIVSPAEWSGLA